MEEPTREELESLVYKGDDPYPDLETIQISDLREGDVLMMLGQGMVEIPPIPFPIPISDLIRALDGGAYSHSTIVTYETLEGGTVLEPYAWDHSVGWSLGPVPVADALKDHRWCHVYRFDKAGEPLEPPRFPSEEVGEVIRQHRTEGYSKALLALAGIAAVVSRAPRKPWVRRLLEKVIKWLIRALEEMTEGMDIEKQALICTSVPSISFWEAINSEAPVEHDYALDADIDRRRKPDDEAGDHDAGWERTQEELVDVLEKIYPNIRRDLAARNNAIFASNVNWIPMGSPELVVNLVTPSDYEYSRTLKRAARLDIPED